MGYPKSNFPQTVYFEGITNGGGFKKRCFYRVRGYFPPRAGQFYLSGAIVQAYRAPNDLSASYWVVEPTHYAVPAKGFQRGEKVEL